MIGHLLHNVLNTSVRAHARATTRLHLDERYLSHLSDCRPRVSN